MGNDAKSLANSVTGALPAGIAGLDENDRAKLADMINTAVRQQAAELGEATEQSLRFVPKLLRGTVRKVVGL